VSQQELLEAVVRTLEATGIEYMVTGAVVSSMQGEPRLTHDIDFVVLLDKPGGHRLVEQFPPERYYLDEKSVLRAIEEQGMFNLIDTGQGTKVDFWMLTDDPFDRSRFARRLTEVVLGLRLMVSSPEDTILQKLKWAKLAGGSEKQFTDALRVYEVQCDRLDIDYLRRWAVELEVEPLLDRIKQEASTL
jgi:hypothetical protein